MSSAPQPAPESRIEIQPSPFVQCWTPPAITSTMMGVAMGEGTRYIGFTPPLDRARIQGSHVRSGEERE